MTLTQKKGVSKWSINIVLFFLITTSCASKYQVMDYGALIRNERQYYYYNDTLNLEIALIPSNYSKKGHRETISLTPIEVELLKNLTINTDSVTFLFKTLGRGTIDGTHYPKLGKTIAYCQTKIDSSLYRIKPYRFHNFLFREGFYKDNVYYEYVIPYFNSYYTLLFINHTRVHLDDYIKTPDVYDYVVHATLEKIEEKEMQCKQTDKFLFSIADSIFDKGNNYLAAEYLKRNMNCSFENNRKKWGVYKQALATYYSFCGQHEKAEKEFSLKAVQPKKLKALKRKEIQDIGRENQFVLFNEAHHIPRHRYIVGSLLKDYYDLGFRYLGLEALFKDSLVQRGYLNYSDGVYTREPVMGNLIREAKQMGYHVFRYEGTNSGQEREKDQVRGIKENVLDINPDAKAIILAGYSHINENCDEQHKWMACLLREELGINPYTINQTELTPKPTGGKEKHGVWYEQENERAHLNDMLIKNTLTIENNCFSLRKHSKIELTIPQEIKIVDKETIVLVYYKDEFNQGGASVIPTHTEVINNGKRAIKLELCEGSYIIQIKDINGAILYSKPVNL